MLAESDKILVMRSITKTFPGVKALDNVDIHVDRNEIHFIVGENGAGKSTLMKVLSGIHPHGSYTGDIVLNDEIQRYSSINDSVRQGIVIINQELALFPDLSVYENVFVGHELANKAGFIDWNETRNQAKKYLDMVGLSVDLDRLVGSLGVGKQQLIEIAKALSQNVKLLILDEPTAALNENDSENLLNLLVDLKKQGITSIMISHKLKEVEAVADSLTVIRDGKVIKRMSRANINQNEIIKAMVGREINNIFPKRPKYEGGDVVLETVHLSSFDTNLNRYVLNDINVKLKKGEVVGLAGLMGAGRTEFAHTVFGNVRNYKTTGGIMVNGKQIKMSHPRDAIREGLAYVSEDRKSDGLILLEDICQNICLSDLKKVSKRGFMNFYMQSFYADKYVTDLSIRTPSIYQKLRNLSGGNQQKVQVAKWLFAEPKILILDEPTRGIDVGAKYEIYTIINDLIAKGMSIIIISSELPEILGMCDRIYVIAEGKQTAEFNREEATAEKIMHSATTA